MAAESDDFGFEPIDWDEVSADGRTLGRRTAAFVVVVCLLALGFCYDYFVVPPDRPTVAGWNLALLDWTFLVSLAVMAFYAVVPLYQNRQLTRQYWRRFRTDTPAVLSLGYLIAFIVVGLFGPVVLTLLESVGVTTAQSSYGLLPYQPPYGFSTVASAPTFCVGEFSNGMCHGSWHHPLGTTPDGADVLARIIEGTHVALQIAVITATLLVPIAVLVGTVAAYFGDWVDEGLMRYVDLQQVLPAFFVYIIAQLLYGGGILLLVAVFGLLNWGGVARLVRSEALQTVEAGYIRAAESAGTGRFRIIRRHLIPNVSNTAITAVTLQIPTLIIIEATVSYLGFGSPTAHSWGNLIATGFATNVFPSQWWVAAFPVLALVLTTVAFSLVGDALRDALDPRNES